MPLQVLLILKWSISNVINAFSIILIVSHPPVKTLSVSLIYDGLDIFVAFELKVGHTLSFDHLFFLLVKAQ